MKIGVISNHFSFPPINYLVSNHLAAGFAVPEILNPANQNIKLVSDTFHLPFKLLHKESLTLDLSNWLSEIKADIVFIFSFPFKIPGSVLNIPHYGFINFHPAILPNYRGPVPLFWQIKNGITETGITAHKLDENFDSGPILYIEKEYINLTDTFGTLSSKLVYTLLKCVTNVVALIENNPDTLPLVEQNESNSSYFGKPHKKNLLIDWEIQNTFSIQNLVRASNPKYHGASTLYKNFPVKLLQVSIHPGITGSNKPGTVINSDDGILLAAADGKSISVDIIYTLEGYFTGASFRNFYKTQIGEIFGK